MKWMTFRPEGAPSVLTTDLCAVYGCGECPEVARARELPEGKMRDSGEAPPDPDATVFCTHECHHVAEEELKTGGEVATVTCPRCGATNTFPGFIDVEQYYCRQCGQLVRVGEGPVQ